MLQRINSTILLFASLSCLWAQKPSKADLHYFQQQYTAAIEAYKTVLDNGQTLSKEQRRNFADAYFKQKDYENAAAIYEMLIKDKDTLPATGFNDFVRALKKLQRHAEVESFVGGHPAYAVATLQNRRQIDQQNLQSQKSTSKLFQVHPINGNSPQNDGSVSFYADSIVFASNRILDADVVGAGYYQLFKSQVLPADTLGMVFRFGKLKDNYPYHRAMPFYVKSLDRMFFGQSNTKNNELLFDEKGRNTISIVSTNSLGNSDIQIRPLLTDYSTSFYYPFYDQTNARLYFAANLYDSYGGTDIYYVETNNGFITGAPINLGPQVNTPANEITPYVLDGSLYFASDVYFGFGGMDLYKSEILEDGSMMPAENLGAPLNTEKDDYGIILKSDGEKGVQGYFVSNRDGGQGMDDIYRIRGKIKPGEAVVHLFGTVTNYLSSAPIQEAVVDVYRGVQQIASLKTNSKGYFDVLLSTGREITLKVAHAHHNIEYREVTNEQIKVLPKGGLVFELHDMQDYIQTKEGKVVSNVSFPKFAESSFLITQDMHAPLKQIATMLDRFPGMILRVEAHTPSKGAQATNNILSQRRAIALRTHLVSLGISKSRITYKGWGEQQLLNKCKDRVPCSNEEHQENNRVLFIISNASALGLVAER